MKKFMFIPLILIICAILIAACSSTSSTTAVPTSSSSGGSTTTVADGKTLMETRCTACHTLAQVVSRTGTAAQWQQVVDQMIQRGAVLNPAEETVLVQYLAANFK